MDYGRGISNAKRYTLLKEGNIVFVGSVSEMSVRFDYEPALIYKSIREYNSFLGMDVREALPFDKTPTHNESKKYEPKRYKDSSSMRFTRL